MKIIIIGLGNFGMSLAVNLSDTGNEVIAADMDMEKIEQVKNKVAHAISFDARNENAYASLPMKNTDMVIIAIGDRNGAAILSTAIVKKLTTAKIIARASSAVEDTILNAMGVDMIVHPEREYAERFTKKINLKGSIDNFEIDKDYLVSEVALLQDLVGKTILESNFRKNTQLNIITIIRKQKQKNILGHSYMKDVVLGTPKPDTVLEEEDVLVVFGKDSDIKNYLNKIHDSSID
ncbi:MAG: TrkA family potassium uptake protein [Sediminicola sp.]|tara:strand:+ start:74015 stop:74719 length:705 start_codon:yes stop_codon:yes gene_type:complete